MSDEKPLIEISDIAGLAKPATALIEKTSNAGVGLFRPWQIKRVAKAEAEARKTHTLMDIEVSDIQQRGMQRLVHEEAKKQENMEAITLEAAKQIKDDAKPEDMDNDWIANFFDKCRLVSDKEMQILWSKLLAGEANKPGAFSKRTVRLVADLDKTEAQMFNNLLNFSWTFNEDISPATNPLIYDLQNEIYKNNDITFESVKHLETIGLISLDLKSGYTYGEGGLFQEFVSYFGDCFAINCLNPGKFEVSNKDHSVYLGHILLTSAGRELSPICEVSPIEGFKEYVLAKWRSFDYAVGKVKSQEQDNHAGT